jgi:hypothetical protein
LRVPPWVLAKKPKMWQEWALMFETAENEAHNTKVTRHDAGGQDTP